MRGTICDISYGGVAILAPQGSYIKENTKVMVTLCLSAVRLDVPGIFLRVDDQFDLKE